MSTYGLFTRARFFRVVQELTPERQETYISASEDTIFTAGVAMAACVTSTPHWQCWRIRKSLLDRQPSQAERDQVHDFTWVALSLVSPLYSPSANSRKITQENLIALLREHNPFARATEFPQDFPSLWRAANTSLVASPPTYPYLICALATVLSLVTEPESVYALLLKTAAQHFNSAHRLIQFNSYLIGCMLAFERGCDTLAALLQQHAIHVDQLTDTLDTTLQAEGNAPLKYKPSRKVSPSSWTNTMARFTQELNIPIRLVWIHTKNMQSTLLLMMKEKQWKDIELVFMYSGREGMHLLANMCRMVAWRMNVNEVAMEQAILSPSFDSLFASAFYHCLPTWLLRRFCLPEIDPLTQHDRHGDVFSQMIRNKPYTDRLMLLCEYYPSSVAQYRSKRGENILHILMSPLAGQRRRDVHMTQDDLAGVLHSIQAVLIAGVSPVARRGGDGQVSLPPLLYNYFAEQFKAFHESVMAAAYFDDQCDLSMLPVELVEVILRASRPAFRLPSTEEFIRLLYYTDDDLRRFAERLDAKSQLARQRDRQRGYMELQYGPTKKVTQH